MNRKDSFGKKRWIRFFHYRKTNRIVEISCKHSRAWIAFRLLSGRCPHSEIEQTKEIRSGKRTRKRWRKIEIYLAFGFTDIASEFRKFRIFVGHIARLLESENDIGSGLDWKCAKRSRFREYLPGSRGRHKTRTIQVFHIGKQSSETESTKRNCSAQTQLSRPVIDDAGQCFRFQNNS